MYENILVPIDGSKSSMAGLEHAISLAKDQQARIRLLNVVDEAIIATMIGDAAAIVNISEIIDSLRAQGRKALNKAHAVAEDAGVKAEAVQVLSRGRPVSEVILREAKRAKSDLIVMGTHGRRGFNRLLLGSDAERVLREAPVPVLLMRQHGRRKATSRRRSPANRVTAAAARAAMPKAATPAARSTPGEGAIA